MPNLPLKKFAKSAFKLKILRPKKKIIKIPVGFSWFQTKLKPLNSDCRLKKCLRCKELIHNSKELTIK